MQPVPGFFERHALGRGDPADSADDHFGLRKLTGIFTRRD
jgi:hypothetical protein